jgi:hypothetical protein
VFFLAVAASRRFFNPPPAKDPFSNAISYVRASIPEYLLCPEIFKYPGVDLKSYKIQRIIKRLKNHFYIFKNFLTDLKKDPMILYNTEPRSII